MNFTSTNREIKRISVRIFVLAVVLAVSYSFPVTRVFAASLKAVFPVSTFAVGDTVPVDILFDPEGESINAIEMTLIVPPNLTVQSTSDANSIVSVWVDRTTEVHNGTLTFSGIIPGGFDGVIDPLTKKTGAGKIMRVFFKPTNTGVGTLSFSESHAYRNDGEGTEATLSMDQTSFTVDTTSHYDFQQQSDTEPPLAFTITRAHDPAVFDDAWFISFQAIDTGSGIDHYEIKEEGVPWVRGESPYRLQNGISTNIFVKAIDHNGNERISKLNPVFGESTVSTRTISILLGILGASILALLVYVALRKKQKHS